MTEGWVDCPPLGPGWQRREVLRKNATRPGQSDTYYMSPRGEKIRSRVELSRLLGCSRDLTDFDFRKGVFVDPDSKIKKGSKKHHLPGAAVPPLPKKPPNIQVLEEPLNQKPLELKLELPKEALATISPQTQEPPAPVETQPTVETQPMETTQPTVEARPMSTTQPTIEAQPMETIQPTVEAQPMERTQPFKRRNRKHHTSILAPGKMGDVTVQETISEETIVCASCQGHFPGVMLPSQRRCRWLCPDCRAQRRDFNREQRYYKGLECGLCQACKITEDCGSCRICLRRQKPGLKRQWKCLKRRCLKRKKKILPKKDGCTSKKLTDEAVPAKDAFTPVRRRKKQPASATVEESPLSCELLDLSKTRNPEMPAPEQQLKLKKQPEMADPVFKQPVNKQPILPLHLREEPEVPRHPTPPTHVKVSAGLPQVKRARGIQEKEVVVLDDEDDDEVEQLEQIRPPVIMEIYSLHDVQPLSQLDNVLQEFLAELNEIPLPAHWEVLPPLGGPDLRLVQRSKHSTMSAAVIHIRPGLFFHVVVQDLPVPLEHKLYTRHPARLTTVDEVVELICDLEAYRLCPGWPAGWHAGERSQACDVLVYLGCCPKCSLNPWPSGSGNR